MIILQAAAIIGAVILSLAMVIEWFDHRRYQERKRWS